MKVYEGKGGAYVTFERTGAWWNVTLRDGSGNVSDKVRCDDYRMAIDYRSAFLKIARKG